MEIGEKLRTRYAPSPTGYLHVGGARTALYNFLLARQTGGQFILRIEDTDRERHDESAVAKIIADLRWLGIEWDEGLEVGGPYGPYRQSERLDLYAPYVQPPAGGGQGLLRLRDRRGVGGHAAGGDRRQAGLPLPAGRKVFPPRPEAEAARSGRPARRRSLLLPGPERDRSSDLAFGEVTMPASEMEDFVIHKADGYPTFYLANVVDDAAMHINLVMRGQEWLGQTWRQVLLREALGLPEPADTPTCR